jgi:transposase
MPYANTDAMNKHLEEIAKAVSPGAQAVVVLDGAGWHSSRKLIVPDNITLLPLPPYSPELNPAENIWEYLRKNKLANRLYETYDDIVDACCEAWNSLMAMPDRITSIAARSWAKAS